MKSVTCAALFAMSALLATTGCATSRGEFTRQNYEALYYSQPQSDVLEIMGEPTSKEPGYWEYKHQRPFYKARVFFQNGEVCKTLWWDEDVEQPSPAPTSKPFGMGSDKPKPKKDKHKHKDENVNVGPQKGP